MQKLAECFRVWTGLLSVFAALPPPAVQLRRDACDLNPPCMKTASQWIHKTITMMTSTNESSGTVTPSKKEQLPNDVKASNKSGDKENKKKSVRVSFSAIAAYTEVLWYVFVACFMWLNVNNNGNCRAVFHLSNR